MLQSSSPEWQANVREEAVEIFKGQFPNAKMIQKLKVREIHQWFSGTCNIPQVFMPFEFGTRICLGQNLDLAELKILIAMIVSKFLLCLSPKYKHSPKLRLIIEPEYGVNPGHRRP
ncbi:hypothetical protein MLD38_011234 [Melastoma candidum]|uniref:Uncharacterized protein n=1 Tax=Melastoma candidum TaxID=119954 RepID=A0ACB9R5G1_9MYRT|nr:hypothetical protein MLD38_011234 [Melastoma candidum]